MSKATDLGDQCKPFQKTRRRFNSNAFWLEVVTTTALIGIDKCFIHRFIYMLII